MFASICHMKGMDVKLNIVNDFVINDQIAEAKSIHDDFGRAYFDRNNGLLTKSIADGGNLQISCYLVISISYSYNTLKRRCRDRYEKI